MRIKPIARTSIFRLSLCCSLLAVGLVTASSSWGEDLSKIPDVVKERVDAAVAKVKPALVRISVVSTSFSDGREWKFEASGSGAIISPDGYVITNHHVAGEATRLRCTLADKEELEAKLVGKDPLTDIAVIKLLPKKPRTFPVAHFGDSSAVRVGDRVLAMGSPMALSQSVTLGIVSNTELVLPEWMNRFGGLTEAGEDVGSLVRWIGHDADIYGGNSGGPLVDLDGKIVGINEISIGLGGAIPGNLAKEIADKLIKDGKVDRAWFGFDIQPRLKSDKDTRGILIGGIISGSPAEKAGFQPGDLLVKMAGHDINVRFPEEVPGFNQMLVDLPIGKAAQAVVLRKGKEKTLEVTPVERQEVAPPEHEIKEWGATMRNISLMVSKELKRDNTNGVLITSVRPGGPMDDAKPKIQNKDVIVAINDKPVKNLADFEAMTKQIWDGEGDPVPTLVAFDRAQEHYVTVVKVGIKELENPGKEVSKAWLPVESQVLTRDIAEEIGQEDLTGFRVTYVYKGTTADKAGLKVGDILLAVDGMHLEATEPEDYEELPTLIRQYKIGTDVDLAVLRQGKRQHITVKLAQSPKASREMAKYENEDFEFTVRDITFFDKAKEKLHQATQGVLVEEVKPGGWAALGDLSVGDLIQEVNGKPTPNVAATKDLMDGIESKKPDAVVIRVLRGIHTVFLELEPKWSDLK